MVSQIGLGHLGHVWCLLGAADDAEDPRHKPGAGSGHDAHRHRRGLWRGSRGGSSGSGLGGPAGARGDRHQGDAEPPRPRAKSALEGSLRRLGTDYVDVYFIHWPNPEFPLARLWRRSNTCARNEIQAIGVSNFGRAEMDRRAPRHHRRPAAALQRALARDRGATLPYCRKHDIGVMPYSGLAQGLLTGTLRATEFVPGDERRTTVLFQPGVRARAGRGRARPPLAQIRQDRRAVRDPVADQPPGVSSPLLGARTVAELEENVGSVGWTLAAADIAAIDRLTQPVWAKSPTRAICSATGSASARQRKPTSSATTPTDSVVLAGCHYHGGHHSRRGPRQMLAHDRLGALRLARRQCIIDLDWISPAMAGWVARSDRGGSSAWSRARYTKADGSRLYAVMAGETCHRACPGGPAIPVFPCWTPTKRWMPGLRPA